MTICVVNILLILCVIGATKASTFNGDTVAFQNFKEKYEVSYDSVEEETLRFLTFQENLRKIERLNAENTSTVFGVNKFADLSSKEFKQRYLTYRPSPVSFRKRVSIFNELKFHNVSTIDANVDWREKGAVTPVKNQGDCGSCWAYSATEQIESNWFLAGNKLDEFSPQQIISCDKQDLGCNGGDTITAYNYIKKAGGIALESQYKDTSFKNGKNGKCHHLLVNQKVGKISGYTYATPACKKGACNDQDEDKMAQNIAAHAPASVCVNAEKWQLYSRGIMTSKHCGKHNMDALDHCVQAVGYSGYNGDAKTAEGAYWIVRNSWEKSWGMEGYIHVEMGANACGIANEATFVTVTSPH